MIKLNYEIEMFIVS